MGLIDTFLAQAVEVARDNHVVVLSALFAAVIAWQLLGSKRYRNLPPQVSYWIPFVGSALQLGVNPITFLEEQRNKVQPRCLEIGKLTMRHF